MGIIKTTYFQKLIWIAFGSSLFMQCRNKTEIFHLDLERSPYINPENNIDYYMINNPPNDTAILLSIVNKILDSSLIYQSKYKVYGQIYYREGIFFNRNYKPHYKWYNNYILDDIRNGESHLENKFIEIYAKNVYDTLPVSPNYPYYIFYDANLIYYPRGFKNNPKKHWKKIKD